MLVAGLTVSQPGIAKKVSAQEQQCGRYGGDAYANAAYPKTSTLFLFIFASPEAEWNTAWTTGTTIMDALAIDHEI
jgi:hypothetical protein